MTTITHKTPETEGTARHGVDRLPSDIPTYTALHTSGTHAFHSDRTMCLSDWHMFVQVLLICLLVRLLWPCLDKAACSLGPGRRKRSSSLITAGVAPEPRVNRGPRPPHIRVEVHRGCVQHHPNSRLGRVESARHCTARAHTDMSECSKERDGDPQRDRVGHARHDLRVLGTLRSRRTQVVLCTCSQALNGCLARCRQQECGHPWKLSVDAEVITVPLQERAFKLLEMVCSTPAVVKPDLPHMEAACDVQPPCEEDEAIEDALVASAACSRSGPVPKLPTPTTEVEQMVRFFSLRFV